jgi:hypothetical protein
LSFLLCCSIFPFARAIRSVVAAAPGQGGENRIIAVEDFAINADSSAL